MRYVDIVGLTESTIPQDILLEGFLDNIMKAIGNKVTKQVTVVTNAVTALQVIAKAISTPEYLETITFMLKQSIKRKLKMMADGPVRQAIIKMFPPGRTLKDFLRGLCLICVANARIKAGAYVKDQVVGAGVDAAKGMAMELAKKVVSLDTLLGSAASGTGIFTVMKALEVGNDILFEVLTTMNKKLMSVSALPAKTAAEPASSAPVNLVKA